MGPKARRAAALKAAQEIIDNRKSLGGDFTDEERTELEALEAEVKECNRMLAKSANADAMLDRLKSGKPDGTRRLTFRGKAAADAIADTADTAGGMGVKSLLAAASSATAPVEVLDGPIMQGRPANGIFDIIPAVEVKDGPLYSYLRQTARALNAAPVAKGAEKPVSTATVERVDGQLEVIAHIVEGLHVYDLSDRPALEKFIADELVWGLGEALAAQVIAGDGVSPNLQGIMNTSGVQTEAFNTNAAITVRRALGKLEMLGYEPGGVLMNAQDWLDVETAQLSNGGYVLGSGPTGAPVDAIERRLWGTRVALANIPAGQAVVLGKDSAAIFHDSHIRVDWNTQRGFKTNEVDVRVEGRFGFGVLRPDAIVVAQLTGA